MSDLCKKRSRKAKLVPRDCGENEENKNMCMEKLSKSLLSELETEDRQLDSLPNPLQNVLPKLRTQLNKTYDHPNTSTAQLQFSVNIEVEEFDEDTGSNVENGISKNDKDSDIQLLKNDELKGEPQWPVYVSDSVYRTTVEKLSKITRALADKILEVHIYNYWGRYANESPEELDYYENRIRDILFYVRQWQKASKFRESILSYKCYICDIGWWHMGPFREHVKEHTEDITISFQTSPHEAEGCIIAHFEALTHIKEIPIEGRCWQCLKTWDEHANMKRNSKPFYSCSSCNYKSPTCPMLLVHESQCLRYQKEHMKGDLIYEIKCICPVCKINLLTEERYKAHMAFTHFVRSDFYCPPVVPLKSCHHCKSNYIFYNTHVCRQKPLNAFCSFCTKRFCGKFLAELHISNTRKNVNCSICKAHLTSQCLEVEHMAKHSKNYVLLYRCTLCENNPYFNNEDSMKTHRKIHYDRKNVKYSFFELMVVPRKLFPALPYNEDDVAYGSVKPHILGPKLAPIPKRMSVAERPQAVGETESAVDALRHSHYDVHDHDYLLRPHSTREPTPPAPKDDTQQQISDQISANTIAAIESISDVTVKTETDDYEYFDYAEMDLVYEDIDIKKEEFLDTVSNAYVSAQELPDIIVDQDISNVFQVQNRLTTIIKDEKQEDELPVLLNHDSSVNLDDAPHTPTKNDIKDASSDGEDFEDDIIVLNNSNFENNIIVVDDNDDSDDVSIISNVEVNETIDISDTETPNKKDDVNETTNDNKTCEENVKKVPKKVNARKIYKCPKCNFAAEHKEFNLHIKNKCPRKRTKRKIKPKTFPSVAVEPWSIYPCTKCNNTYPKFNMYIAHLQKQHQLYMTCPECLEIFCQPTRLIRHIKGHIRRLFTKIHIILKKDTFITSKQDSVYQCKKCIEAVKYRKFFGHWESHLRLHTKRKVKVECKVERSEVLDEGLLTGMELASDTLQQVLDLLRAEPQRACAGSPLHQCLLCARAFDRVAYLKRHYVEHLLKDAIWRRVKLRTEDIACQICKEEFTNNLTYKQHMRNHASLAVYRCELCSRSFSDSSNFAKHRKVHNMAAAVCDVCGAKFFRKDSLIKHMEVHQLAEPLTCEPCNKTFTVPTQYRKHCRTVHSHKTSSFTCNVCLMKFARTRDRLDHMWAAHHIRKVKVDCPVCNRSFRKFADMKDHLKVKHSATLKLTSKHFYNASETDRSASWAPLDHQSKKRYLKHKREVNGVDTKTSQDLATENAKEHAQNEAK